MVTQKSNLRRPAVRGHLALILQRLSLTAMLGIPPLRLRPTVYILTAIRAVWCTALQGLWSVTRSGHRRRRPPRDREPECLGERSGLVVNSMWLSGPAAPQPSCGDQSPMPADRRGVVASSTGPVPARGLACGAGRLAIRRLVGLLVRLSRCSPHTDHGRHSSAAKSYSSTSAPFPRVTTHANRAVH